MAPGKFSVREERSSKVVDGLDDDGCEAHIGVPERGGRVLDLVRSRWRLDREAG